MTPALSNQQTNGSTKKLLIIFAALYFIQGTGEPRGGLLAQPLRSMLKGWGKDAEGIAWFMFILGIAWYIKPVFGLENVDEEFVVEFPVDDLLRRLDDPLGERGIELAEVAIDLGGGPFDQPEGTDETPSEAIAADGEVLGGPLSLGSPIGRCRYGHLAHAVPFYA